MKLGEFELNKIYCMDCLEGMKNIPDDSVDIIITSPPYNINSKKYKNYKDNLTSEDYISFISCVLKELLRITKYYVFFNFQILKENRDEYYKIMNIFQKFLKCEFIWAKSNPVNISKNGNVCRGFEYIMCYSKNDNKDMIFKRGEYTQKNYVSNTIIKPINNENKYSKVHKATFPLWLPKYFIKYFSNTNDIILDPFIGTGTTAVACKQLGRKFIGFEISPEYCKISNKRLEQQTLF